MNLKLKHALLIAVVAAMIFLLSGCVGVPAPTKPQIVFHPSSPFAGQNVNIEVLSKDDYSSLSYELSVDGAKLVGSAPGVFQWKAVLGTHTFVATVTDTYNHSVSTVSTLIVESPPPPSVTKMAWYPAAPIGGENVEFTLNATSVIGISDVEMRIDGNALRTFEEGSTYFATWTAVPGKHALGIMLKDKNGQITSTQTVVNVGPYPFPKIMSFTWTPQNPSLKDRYVRFEVVGRDPTGFYTTISVDGKELQTALLSSDTAVATWDVSAGYHTVKVRLEDSKGWYVERTCHIPIQPLQSDLNVQIGITPKAPQHGDKVTIKAYASDSYAPIENMVLFIDGSEELQVATNTLSFSFYPSDGSHEVTVKAVDKLNAKTSSNLFFSVRFDPQTYPPDLKVKFTRTATVGIAKLLTVYATATAPGARITNVWYEDLISSSMIGESTSCSNGLFSIAWIPKRAGYIPIMVNARDTYGTLSSTVVMVNVSPKLLSGSAPLIKPDFDSFIKESSRVELCASVTSRYPIQKVKMWVDNVPLTPSKKSSGLYCVEWIAQATGTHVFKVFAEDSYGRQASETFYFYVYPGKLPVVKLALNSVRFYTGQSLIATAEVIKSTSQIDHVNFYVDGKLVSASYTPPYVLRRKVENVGIHTLTAEAIDVYGNKGYAQVNYQVLQDKIPPFLSVDAPATAASGEKVTVKIRTFDEETKVKTLKVDLYSSNSPQPYPNIIPVISRTYSYPATETFFTFTAASNTVYEIHVTSEDVAGNKANFEKKIVTK